ncbi:peptidylprolyl isomerase [Pedobacter heparinus]|uniref:peptidylprolyl isomerase n=1 Tax=Pedobacter heparinus (strain ATCC 13125 / DSM 2366 / CIP 104194 / JCM 7457 / NBRC 12017 / NCIMB 9290 / NRRL B-14731 / HIM 762-3) TaxID=485917 RepID=C6Y3B3_PEDHD|nr:peptidylprolyl isomerase [Pedobacter heparinus]ACU05338.1 peptidyl-prolyl cis-trans isomerase cyclophilin type [Pedobacter heparinus DSM 2366]
MKILVKYWFILLIFSVTTQSAVSQSKNDRYVKITTRYGECIVRLYNETPIHKDNFLKLVKVKYFDKTTFNRVIKEFVIQGGDTDAQYVNKETLGPLQKWLPAEFHDSLFHKRGVLAMGRDDNREKASFSTQFYIVDGKTWTDKELDEVEKKALSGYKIPARQREIYKTIGGTPFLDHNYTVFGEIVKGSELIDKLVAVKISKDDSPAEPIEMKITVLRKPAPRN